MRKLIYTINVTIDGCSPPHKPAGQHLDELRAYRRFFIGNHFGVVAAAIDGDVDCVYQLFSLFS